MRFAVSMSETRHRQSGDDLLQLQDKKARREFERRRDDCAALGLALLERTRSKKFTALLFGFTALLVLFLITTSQMDAILKARFEQLKLLHRQPTSGLIRSSCKEDDLLRWMQRSTAVRALRQEHQGDLRVGVVNFRSPESIKWELFSGGPKPVQFRFRSVDRRLNWSDFFPEQIGEDKPELPMPKCPTMPLPSVRANTSLDMVVAAIPCDKSARDWSRDVDCLQAFLAAAKVAAETGEDFVHVVLCSECRPILNLFRCKELIEHHDGFWLYKLDVHRLRRQLQFPVGSCELALPLKSRDEEKNHSREAYATILHSAESYVCGAISLAHSIRRTGSTRDMVILVDNNIKIEHRHGLELAGWKVIVIDRIRNPKAEPESYNEWNYSKFRLWQLTQYDKLIYIDSDIILLRNLDLLFDLPEISATRNDVSLFNSGVMVVEPSNCTFEFLVNNINNFESYNGGDQGYLNEVYTWWHRLPETINFLKHFDNNTVENRRKVKLFTSDPPQVYAMHFLGRKPWLCFRDYDCNWNQNQLHIFANDAVHAQWWKLHDTMPPSLQKFCLLTGRQKFMLEWDILKAKQYKYHDRHWKRRILDPRWHAVKATESET